MTTSGALESQRISTLIYDTPQNSLSAAVDVAINSYSGLMNGFINFTFFTNKIESGKPQNLFLKVCLNRLSYVTERTIDGLWASLPNYWESLLDHPAFDVCG